VKTKYIIAGSLTSVILVADVLTKRWALDALDHGLTRTGFAGVPLTLAYNTGIAFGVNVPMAARWLLVAASLFVVVMLGSLLLRAREADWPRFTAIGLVTAGAIGNLIDRVRWDLGVVDFIGPFDLGFMHWPIFNIADMAITVGAVALGVSLWREDARERAIASVAPEPAVSEPIE
jgi:signal peptidase II